MNINPLKLTPNITAQSIISKTQETANSSNINTTDSIETSSEKKLDFKKPSLIDFYKNLDENTKYGLHIGAGFGAAAGGVTGGILAYNMSMNKIQATNTDQTITVNWQEPVIKSQDIGSTPESFFQPTNSPSIATNEYVTVYKNNPVMENGTPLMQEKTKTFTGLGTPVVKWEKHEIVEEKMSGFIESTRPEIDTKREYTGKDWKGFDNYKTTDSKLGEHHIYTPTITYSTVGEYQTPKVKFDTGVNVGLNTAFGALLGAGAGALVGGIAGAAIARAISE